MSKLARRLAIGTATAVAAVATGFQFQRWFSEQPKYEVLRSVGALEVRRYEPRVAATTRLSSGESKGDGFRILAGYIFGGNATEESIAMTSPVVSESQASEEQVGRRIAMTSPVETENDRGGMRMQFMMPREFALSDLPTPTDPRVELRELPSEVVAALRFSGSPTEREFEAKKQQAMRLALDAELNVKGAPRVAQYDPPWTLGWFRRNEILVPLAE